MEYKKVEQKINNIVNDNVKMLAQLFPSAVKDGEIDFEALKIPIKIIKHINNHIGEFIIIEVKI